MLNWLWNTYWTRGSVRVLGSERITNGKTKSFQCHMQVRIPTVAFIGVRIGKMTFRERALGKT